MYHPIKRETLLFIISQCSEKNEDILSSVSYGTKASSLLNSDRFWFVNINHYLRNKWLNITLLRYAITVCNDVSVRTSHYMLIVNK